MSAEWQSFCPCPPMYLWVDIFVISQKMKVWKIWFAEYVIVSYELTDLLPGISQHFVSAVVMGENTQVVKSGVEGHGSWPRDHTGRWWDTLTPYWSSVTDRAVIWPHVNVDDVSAMNPVWRGDQWTLMSTYVRTIDWHSATSLRWPAKTGWWWCYNHECEKLYLRNWKEG